MRFLYAPFIGALVLMLAVAFAASGETYVRPDTTTGTMVAAGDSLFALDAGGVRYFNLNDIPMIETTVPADSVVNLGDANRVEFKAYGAGDPDGHYFRVVVSAGTRTVYYHYYIGSADSVRINAWQY